VSESFSGHPSVAQIHVGRQPIYDRSGDVIAYELLFRDTADATAASQAGTRATSQVMVVAFTEFGVDELVGTKACFINVTRDFLVGDLDLPFDCGHAGLEIIESVVVDDAVVEGVTDLVARGFTVALDDFSWGSDKERLLHLATYVKINLLNKDADSVAEDMRRFSEYPRIQLIAERLEDEEQFQLAFRLGFNFFQGHVLGYPHVLSRATLSPARATRLQMLAVFNQEDVSIDEVGMHVTRDPALSYRLLQATNSAASGMRAQVSSVHEAIVMLGLAKVRAWITLMLLGDFTELTEDPILVTMTRARFCQLVAVSRDASGDSAFTVGLLSGISDTLGQPPATLVSQLPLAPAVRAALVEHTGELGDVLEVVCAYERGLVDAIGGPVGSTELTHAYLSALRWANQILLDVPTTPRRREMTAAVN
jgi:c-di-GMP-related signal transduction protein